MKRAPQGNQSVTRARRENRGDFVPMDLCDVLHLPRALLHKWLLTQTKVTVPTDLASELCSAVFAGLISARSVSELRLGTSVPYPDMECPDCGRGKLSVSYDRCPAHCKDAHALRSQTAHCLQCCTPLRLCSATCNSCQFWFPPANSGSNPSTSNSNSFRGPRGDRPTNPRTNMRSVWLLGSYIRSYISSYHPMTSLQLHGVQIHPMHIGALFVMLHSSVLTNSLESLAVCELVDGTFSLGEKRLLLMASPDLQP
jgi:hypothetical protein